MSQGSGTPTIRCLGSNSSIVCRFPVVLADGSGGPGRGRQCRSILGRQGRSNKPPIGFFPVLRPDCPSNKRFACKTVFFMQASGNFCSCQVICKDCKLLLVFLLCLSLSFA